MPLVKFITIFDDEKHTLFTAEITDRYNLSVWPASYDDENRTYVDMIHTDSVKYIRQKSENKAITTPDIPHRVFQYAIQKAYDEGYALAMIVCPNRKWYPYYYAAVKAADNFRRSLKKDFTTFRISVIDTQGFAAGHLYHTLRLARLHYNDHCPTGIIEEDAKCFSSKMLCLTESGGKFGMTEGKLSAFRVFGKRFYEDVKISESVDYIVFDNFAKYAAKYIRLSGGKYIISVGADCWFAANVIGRIESILGYAPVAVVQYAVASADIFGLKSLCIHMIDKM